MASEDIFFLWVGGDLNREVFIWFLKRMDFISIDTAQQTYTGTQRLRALITWGASGGPRGACQLTGTWPEGTVAAPTSRIWAKGMLR